MMEATEPERAVTPGRICTSQSDTYSNLYNFMTVSGASTMNAAISSIETRALTKGGCRPELERETLRSPDIFGPGMGDLRKVCDQSQSSTVGISLDAHILGSWMAVLYSLVSCLPSVMSHDGPRRRAKGSLSLTRGCSR